MSSTAGIRKSQPREGVFISYARSDGEAYASRLRALLDAEHVPLWQDRVSLEGGRDWWLQITEALGRVEFMVLVVTPNALRSDTVRKEWRHARQQGVCVYPVKGAPDLDFESLPGWMRDAHFYDLGALEGGAGGHEWAKFLNDLRTRCRTPRVPFMVEDLPDDFVMRADEFDSLRALLLDAERGEPVAITAALKGAGGYGKTTLARALCHDERVQDAFDDGVLWVTLGETPGDLTGRVEDLIYKLSDERPGFTGIDAAVAHFVELLADRDLLIVVDDVWNPAHLKPFLQGGPRCARLITTRNADTLPPNAKPINVDAMRQGEAVELLRAGVPHGCDEELYALAKRIGEWPLLLKLVNGTLRDRVNNTGQPLAAAINYCNQALDKRGLTYFDARNAAAREQAVKTTLRISLDLLTPPERERYEELAVFPEDADVPLATLARYWGATGGLDEFDTEDLCHRLNSLSLLLHLNLSTRHLRLHDVIRAYLSHERKEGLRELHRQLLDAHVYGPPGGGEARGVKWSWMPVDEPYFWRHLAEHLIEAGRADELTSTVKSLRYLAAKTFLRKSPAAEADLLAAERQAPADAPLRLLRQNFVQSGHILHRCERLDELEVALYSRLSHVAELSDSTRDFEPTLKPPYLLPFHPLPDLPLSALVRELSGHAGAVACCAVSPDGSFIVSGSWDRTLRVWDARDGSERRKLCGHLRVVSACAVSPDSSFIVSASWDRTLKVWDARSGDERLTLSGHAGNVNGCAVSPDGASILSASDDGTLKVWDARSGRELLTFPRHNYCLSACAVSADGALAVSASVDGTLSIWEMDGARRRATLSRHWEAVTDCRVCAGGGFIVSASEDGTLRTWSLPDGRELRNFWGHTGRVTSCDVSVDGTLIVSTSEDGTLKAWDGATGDERLTVWGHTGQLTCCALSPDGSFVVSGSWDRTLKVWRVQTGGEAGSVRAHSRPLVSCTVSPDDSFVLTLSDDGVVHHWDVADGGGRRVEVAPPHAVTGCAISPDGTLAAFALGNGKMLVRELKAGGGSKEFRTEEPAHGCAISPDNSVLAYVTKKRLFLWDLEAWRQDADWWVGQLPGGCTFTSDGKQVLTWSIDGTFRLTGVRDRASHQHFTAHERSVSRCAISPDDSFAVSASWDQTLKVWTDEGEQTLRGHSGIVTSCDISRDGKLIASSSVDKTLKVWDAQSGQCLTTFYVDGPLNDCKWLSDSRRLAAVGFSGVYFMRLVV